MNRNSIVPPLAAAVLAIVSAPACLADFQPGDMITYSQSAWGDPGSSAGTLLAAHYNSVYASTFGILEVGIPGAGGFSMQFSSSSSVLSYLPGIGPAGQLTGDLLDPVSSPSGVFGGSVVGLTLNVEWADEGHTLGALGIPFGDLVIHDYTDLPQINGLTVREFLGEASILLGGGSVGYSVSQAHLLNEHLNASFEGDGVSPFAQNYLMAVPEPSTAPLALFGMLGVGRARRRRA